MPCLPTQEIGLRLTLGAQRGDVLRIILRQATVRILIGAAAGLTGAILLTRVMSRLLYVVQPSDPATFAGATAFLISVALLADEQARLESDSGDAHRVTRKHSLTQFLHSSQLHLLVCVAMLFGTCRRDCSDIGRCGVG